MGKVSSGMKILYGEGDAEVVAAQAVSLQKAGHQVQTAVGRKAVLEALQTGGFELVVLGPTLTRDDRHHLTYKAKKAQDGIRVLVMHSDGNRHPEVDICLETGRTIDDVVARIAALGGKSSGAAAGR